MEHINQQNVPQTRINSSYQTGYRQNKRAANSRTRGNQRENSAAQDLLQRLDAIDARHQYKPSLYDLFNRMDASAISNFIQG